MKSSFKFMQNRDCAFFPCHEMDEDQLNCLFCYCPLYPLKDQCGGTPIFLEDGTKDCSTCTTTHQGDSGYNHVMSKIMDVLELGKK